MTRSFHPLSLVLGLVLGVVCLLTMSQTTVNTPARIEYLAHPRDYVQIRYGTPYVVPAGKLFVPTALGTNESFNTQAALDVNGVTEIRSYTGSAGGVSSLVNVPSGLAVPAGSTVSLSYATNGRAWGYLVAQ